MNYTQEKEQAKAKDKDGDGDEEDDPPLPESTLPEKVQELITDICNIQMMEGAMREIGYDASKMPLGQLSESNIKKGFECLQLISECLEEQTKTKKSLRTRLGNLSSQFYTFIPHDFGMARMSQFILDCDEDVVEKHEMLKQLADITLATKILNDKADTTK